MTAITHEQASNEPPIAVLYQNQSTSVKEANFVLFLPNENLTSDELLTFKQQLNADLLIAVMPDKATIDYPCLQVADKTIYCDYQYIPQLMALFNDSENTYVSLDASDFKTCFADSDKVTSQFFRTNKDDLEQDCQTQRSNLNTLLLNSQSPITAVIHSIVSPKEFSFEDYETILNTYSGEIHSESDANFLSRVGFKTDDEYYDIFTLIFSNSTKSKKTKIEPTEKVTFKEVAINLMMGKDVADKTITMDLCRSPHLLVAGNASSSQSAFLKSLVLDIAKLDPKQACMILIDLPKINFSVFEELPHLLMPIITDVMTVNKSLMWCINEMDRRYQMMSLFKVRKIDDLNKTIADAKAQNRPIIDPLYTTTTENLQEKPPALDNFPKIVVVINELAELIIPGHRFIEEKLVRLCQKGRACGIHLIVATQKLSADVITGLIKANVPARIAFQVDSPLESRFILDEKGAENLANSQDRLFLGGNIFDPILLHGDFPNNEQIQEIYKHWANYQKPNYLDLSKQTDLDIYLKSEEEIEAEDSFYQDAVNFVLETRKASASIIQRKFYIGYHRASRMIDMMEERGIISPLGMNGKREVLVNTKA